MKRLFALVSIILLFLILPYCKTADEFSLEIPYESKSVSIFSISGRGTYDSVKNESTIDISIAVMNQLALQENIIINWRIKLFLKDEFLLEINQDNYKTITGDCARVQIMQPYDPDQSGGTKMGWLFILATNDPDASVIPFYLSSSGKPIPGDFYNGKNPDLWEVIITFKTSTGYIYEDSQKGKAFTFSRS